MNLVAAVRDQVRSLLHIRKARAIGRSGPRPGIGARIAFNDVRMQVQAGMNSSLWNWLAERGWREITYRPERRRYRDIPLSYVTRLTDCAPTARQRVLNAGIANAAHRRRDRARKFGGAHSA